MTSNHTPVMDGVAGGPPTLLPLQSTPVDRSAAPGRGMVPGGSGVEANSTLPGDLFRYQYPIGIMPPRFNFD
jgi:hypothetical protein